jgi:hypothetical protein
MYASVTWGRGPLSAVQLAPRKGKIKPEELKVRQSSIFIPDPHLVPRSGLCIGVRIED